MIWASASDFFAMGGYGLYVWGSYAVTALLMATEPVLAVRRRRQALIEAGEASDASNSMSKQP